MLDELACVRAHRSDVPEPDEGTIAAARAQLMATIADGPRPRTTGAERGENARRRVRRVQRRRRLVLAGGLTTLGVGVAGVLGLTTAATPVSALAAQMDQMARIAASQAWTGTPGPGQYLYTASQGPTETDTMGNGRECAIAQMDHRQSWIATDGSGAISEVRDQSRFTSAADRATCAALGITDAGSQDSSSQNGFAAGGLSSPVSNWRGLSTDPQTLLKQAHQRDGGPDTPAEWFTNVADFLRETDVPPAIRAALYRAAALIPGVRLLGTQTDPTGQTGLGVAFYANGVPTHELIFDRQDARLLAEKYFDQTGVVVDWTAYTEQRIVDSAPSYPLNPTAPGDSAAGGAATPAAG